MKYKLLIFGMLLLSLILLCGCVENKSGEFCSILKHSPDFEDTVIYMDNGVCVIEKENYSYSYYLECNSMTEKASFIMKTNQSFLLEDEMPKNCEVIEI